MNTPEAPGWGTYSGADGTAGRRRVIGMDTAGSAGRARPERHRRGLRDPDQPGGESIANQVEAGTSSSTVHIGATAFLGLGVADTVGGAGITSAQSLTDQLLTERPGTKVQLQHLDSTGTQHPTTVQLASGPPQ